MSSQPLTNLVSRFVPQMLTDIPLRLESYLPVDSSLEWAVISGVVVMVMPFVFKGFSKVTFPDTMEVVLNSNITKALFIAILILTLTRRVGVSVVFGLASFLVLTFLTNNFSLLTMYNNNTSESEVFQEDNTNLNYKKKIDL